MYTNELLITIKNMRNNGKKLREISSALDITISTVQWVLRDCKKKIKRKTGPKPHISKRYAIRIRKYIKICNEKGKKATCQRIINETNLNVSRKTLNNWLLSEDYKFEKQAQSIQITQNHKNKRMELVSSWIENNIVFENSVFTDEKKFNLDGPDNWYIFTYNLCYYDNTLYRHTWTSKQNIKISRQRRHTGGGGIMYWGMLMPNGLISLKKVIGNLNSEKYIHLLDSYAVPLMKMNATPNCHFIQDNCSSHKSKKTMKFLRDKNVQVLEWPPLSPDINLMEDIWRMLSNLVYQDGQPRNLIELEEKVQYAVHELNMNRRHVMLGLYSSFRKRLTTILRTGGNLYK